MHHLTSKRQIVYKFFFYRTISNFTLTSPDYRLSHLHGQLPGIITDQSELLLQVLFCGLLSAASNTAMG